MGSIAEYVPSKLAAHPSEHKCLNGPDDRNSNLPAQSSRLATQKRNKIAVELEIPNASSVTPLASLVAAWLLFIWRDSLAVRDSDWIVSAESNTGQIHELKLHEIITSDDRTVCSLLKNIAEQMDCSGPADGSASVLVLRAKANDLTFGVDCSINGRYARLQGQEHHSLLSAGMLHTHLLTIADISALIHQSTYNSQVKDVLRPTSSELDRIWSWNAELPAGIPKSIHQYFLEQSKAHPDAEAVVSWDRSFTYRKVEELSRHLACKLRSQGIRDGSFIPLCFEKSAWTVIALMAVIRAGAAFVLTDPSQPESRLKTIFEEIDAKIVLTSERYQELGHKLGAEQVISVGPGVESEIDSHSEDLEFQPRTLYVIFTSGSTGKPKGVVISHEAYTTGAVARADIIGYGLETRVLDFVSYAFDVSIDCMLLTLATGGCICIPSEDDRINDLSNAIRKMHVNMLHTTPSIARVLDGDIIPSLRVLGLGGEAVPAHDACRWNEQTHGGVRIAYGPSECTVGCTFCKFDEGLTGKSYTSLGKGCGGCLWIVKPDDHNELTPIGAAGELLVEGPIVGQGYLNEPEKTSAVFIDPPEWLKRGNQRHCGRKSSRLYKTGDLVRYDPDDSGAIVFVGRKDQQVKIRGQRVELEEVEYHLRQRLPPKTAVAAEVVQLGDGDPLLVAFVVEHITSSEKIVSNGTEFSNDFKLLLHDLVNRLAKEVPKYMVPAAFVPVEKIPTLVSGKTDRKSLRTCGGAMSRTSLAAWRKTDTLQPSHAPLVEQEQILAGLWLKVLVDTPRLSKSDDFFAIGGDSLKAMRLVSLTRQKGFSLSTNAIFRFPTLVEMAQQLVTVKPEEQQHVAPFSLVPQPLTERDIEEVAVLCNVKPASVEDLLPCTPLQEGLIALSNKVPDAYVAQRVLQLNNDTVDQFEIAVQAVVAQCEILRTRIVYSVEKGLLQVVTGDIPVIRQRRGLQSYLTADRANSMTLGTPLCRMTIVEDVEAEQVHFVITMHHALYDGWSMPLIADQINRAFRNEILIKRTPFSHFVRYLQDMDRVAAERYWRDLLSGTKAENFPRLPSPEYQTKADSLLERQINLPNNKSSKHTLATTIRASWALTMAQHQRSQEVTFGETLTGRNADVHGIEEIEGPLITTVPMRLMVDRAMTKIDFLDMIQKQTTERMPHEHFGLQNIRLLSKDARRACDLRTGFVLHPCVEDESAGDRCEGPASGLVPAGDLEAAQEALKFNSYALMMVCTLENDGFLTMASFDSNTTSKKEMESLLESFGQTVQALTLKNVGRLSEICPSLPGSTSIEEEQPLDSPKPSPSAPNPPNQTSITKSESLSSVQKVCSRILKVDPLEVAAVDDFFDLGGDSIGAMKLVAELRQRGWIITVADVFAQRKLSSLQLKATANTGDFEKPSADVPNTSAALTPQYPGLARVRELLTDPGWQVETVYSARPLQAIAVDGTVNLPRYSVRYELLHINGDIDTFKLRQACQQLVSTTEILRTTFVQHQKHWLAVVLRDVPVLFDEFQVEKDVASFARKFCEVDVQQRMFPGSLFVKFALISSGDRGCCLVFKLSHAQYDEICLPSMLDSLSMLYQGQVPSLTPSFSAFVKHIEDDNTPKAIRYWRDLLKGSSMTKLSGPALEPEDRTKLVSLTKAVSTVNRPKHVTLASFPSAAWALCLARRLRILNVVFGEVLTGRNSGMSDADLVAGPCWQYSPTRVQMRRDWTGHDLLSLIQTQHAVSSEYASLGLSDIVEHCTDWPKDTTWFDSVVHQAVKPTESLTFGTLESTVETIYPHLEPLREWKIQAFADADTMELEIVTFAGWEEYGQTLLDDLVVSFEQLLKRPQEMLLSRTDTEIGL